MKIAQTSILLVFCLLFASLNAQETEAPKEKWFDNVLIQLRLTRNHSHVYNSLVNLNGLRLGVEYKNKYRFGFQFIGIVDTIGIRVPINTGNEFNSFGFSAQGLYLEFLVKKNFRWEIGVPIDFGYGIAHINKLNEFNELIQREETEYFLFSQIGLNVQYNFNNWLGFNVGAGYRQAFSDRSNIVFYTSHPFYDFGFRFKVFGLASSIFNRRAVLAKKRAYFEEHNKKGFFKRMF